MGALRMHYQRNGSPQTRSTSLEEFLKDVDWEREVPEGRDSFQKHLDRFSERDMGPDELEGAQVDNTICSATIVSVSSQTTYDDQWYTVVVATAAHCLKLCHQHVDLTYEECLEQKFEFEQFFGKDVLSSEVQNIRAVAVKEPTEQVMNIPLYGETLNLGFTDDWATFIMELWVPKEWNARTNRLHALSHYNNRLTTRAWDGAKHYAHPLGFGPKDDHPSRGIFSCMPPSGVSTVSTATDPMCGMNFEPSEVDYSHVSGSFQLQSYGTGTPTTPGDSGAPVYSKRNRTSYKTSNTFINWMLDGMVKGVIGNADNTNSRVLSFHSLNFKKKVAQTLAQFESTDKKQVLKIHLAHGRGSCALQAAFLYDKYKSSNTLNSVWPSIGDWAAWGWDTEAINLLDSPLNNNYCSCNLECVNNPTGCLKMSTPTGKIMKPCPDTPQTLGLCENQCGVAYITGNVNYYDTTWGHGASIGCSCDQYCEQFDDCCIDYQDSCGKRRNEWINSTTIKNIRRPVSGNK